MKTFKIDNPFFNTMDQIGDLVILNLLWLVCCLPIFTIGASTLAMTQVTMEMASGEAPVVSQTFFRVFKEQFKPATLVFLFFLATGVILFLDLLISPGYPGLFGGLLLAGSVAFGVVWMWSGVYVFPVMLTFRETIKETLIKSLIMSVLHLPSTLAISGIVLAPILLAIWKPALVVFVFPLFAVIGSASISLGTSYFTKKVMKKHGKSVPK